MNLNEYLEKIEGDIQKTDEGLKKQQQLQRLQEAHRVYKGEDRVVTTEEILEEIKSEPEEIKYFTGWDDLDNILKGFRPNQVVSIAALTKSGKTSFSIDLTSRFEEHRPLWFAFEETPMELVQKFLDRDEKPPVFVTPRRNRFYDLQWLENKIVEGIVKYNCKMVFIDHIDFLVPFVGDRHDLKIAEVMRRLKAIAKTWGLVVFLMVHLKQADIDKHPTLKDIRGSASIAQESDTVLLFWRQAKRRKGEVEITDNVNISVQANRRTGKTGNVRMKYENGHFIPFDWTIEEDETAKDFNNW